MNLILWRHAEAEYGPPDLERQLTIKGHHQAETMATWLQNHLPENYQVWASQAMRSQQTAGYLNKKPTILSTINPNIDARSLPRLLENVSDNATIIIVGHQPWIGEFCSYLLNGQWHDGHYWSVKKSGFWWFQVKVTESGYTAKLKAALTPCILA